MEPQPIKRSVQLQPLSREHHEGLLFVWKIRQGLRNGTDVALMGRFVQWFWETHLDHHFKTEEQVLLPLLPGDALLARMLDEHQEIEALLHINQSIPDPALLEQIAQQVNDHIRFEERELFPHIEQAITEEQLNGVAAALLSDVTSGDNSWTEEFWTRE